MTRSGRAKGPARSETAAGPNSPQGHNTQRTMKEARFGLSAGHWAYVFAVALVAVLLFTSCAGPAYGVRKQPKFRTCKSAHRAIGH